MRRRALLALPLFAILAIAANCELRLSPTKSVSFLLEPGQTARAEDLRVRFLEVVSDTRCPANVTCVSAGDAVVAFELRTITTADVELHVVDPARRAAVFDGYVITLTALGPYPVDGQTIDDDDYRAAIEVRRQ